MNINLFPVSERTFSEKVLYFSLHYLRYIIVLTQITVIAVFFFRFKVDQEIIDLKEKVTQKQEIFKITKPLLTEAKNVEKKLSNIKTLIDQQAVFNANLGFVFSSIPEGMTLNEVGIDNKQVYMKGEAISVLQIKHVYDIFNEDKRFKEAAISALEKDKLTGIFSFVLSAKL